jgi:glycosyltransferase involved in cell wall biosynthesis
MADESLKQLFDTHQGKVSDKWQGYLAEYERFFSRFRQEPVRLLEIGVQNGGSLEIWAKFFPRAELIVGCDVDPRCSQLEFDDARINVVVGDINLAETQARIQEYSSTFEIIIDDGSHKSSDIVKSFSTYFDFVAENGVYIVEDLHCSYWQEFEGGLFAPYSAMSFFKTLTDSVNYPQWGVDKACTSLFRGFSEKYGVKLKNTLLQQVHSIEFLNSMCLVRKLRHENNRLGHRVIAGRLEPVEEGHLDLPANLDIEVLPQTSGGWEDREARMRDLSKQLADSETRLVDLGRKEKEYKARLAGFYQHMEERDTQLITMKQELIAHRALLDYVRDSQTWRWTDLFRRIGYRKTFDPKFYLERYPDVAQSGMDPIEHFVAYGRREGREPRPPTRMSYFGKVTGAFKSIMAEEGGLLRSIVVLFDLLRSEGLSGARVPVEQALGQEELVGYSEWVRAYDTLNTDERIRIRHRIDSLKSQPLISVVMPTYNTNLEWLKGAVQSVRTQLYPNWELCIADDASTDHALKKYLETLDREDERIKVVFRQENGHISRASNSALDLCSGEWVALLDHDDLLAEHALFCVARAIDDDPSLQLVYSDEDKFDQNGVRFDPNFKTDWNPELFYSYNMISHLGVYRKETLHRIGGFRAGFEGSQDYDLALRFIEQIDQKNIHHIPRVLYHWRVHPGSTASSTEVKPYALVSAEKALQEHFARRDVAARVESLPYGYRVRYDLPEKLPLISLIIPTRNERELLSTCIESILAKTTYSNYEILIVDNGSDDPEILEYFAGLEQRINIRVMRDERPFNFSMLNNFAVREARGELLGFINNDIEVISGEWLSEMVSMALQDEIGAVGAKLLYPDKTVQHAGVVLGIGGVAENAFKGTSGFSSGLHSRALRISSFSAVTAACLVIRKKLFLEAGGFDEKYLAVAFGDVDFCLRLRELGYRNVFNPYALLYHHESASRGEDDTPEKQARFDAEFRCMHERWGKLLLNDPAYNPNLTLDRADFSLAWPPRVGAVGDNDAIFNSSRAR